MEETNNTEFLESEIDEFAEQLSDKDLEQLGYGHGQTKETKRKIAKSLMGKKNPAYKDGRRLDYRKMKGLKKGDSRVVHHKDNDRTDNKPSNLKVVSRKTHEGKIHHRGNNFRR